ncbi:unnamed protein product [Ceutorhynchus assimilis]|uniref:Major facilitator superfamily (MFS) profile domain-containing protein n=1 Tax=Ceutorhynchus assimilis TaxID=467358 RepID=A0A9N9MMW4_9CUCU|nr:unnamed protein product [Ceutorhynchus assimilis]
MGVLENTSIVGKSFKKDEGKVWPQILAICAVSLGPLNNGMQFVWSSPFALVISQDPTYDVTEADTSQFMLYQSSAMILFGFLFFSLSEKVGRKKCVLFLAIPLVATWLMLIFARTKWEFIAARFIAGIADAVFFTTVPSYIGEISTPTVRGTFGNTPILFFYLGQLIINTIGSYCSVTLSAYICLPIPIIFFISVLFIPESPYQLIKDNKLEEAKASLKWLRRKQEIEEDYAAIKADVERQISESASWLDLVRIRSNMRALRAGIFVRVSQQFCGISTFASYTQTIFQQAGTSLSPQYSSIIFTGLIIILNLIFSISVEKFGRKPSYFYSLLSAGGVLLALAIYFFLEQFQLVNLEQIKWFPLAGMFSWVFAYSFGLGLVPTLMLGELFSASIKSKALGVLMVFFGAGIMLTNAIYHLMVTNIGMYSPFLVYAIACFLSSFLVLSWVPETKGKTLEEIQQTLKGKKL